MCRMNSRERILVIGIKSDDAGMLQDSLADLAEVAFCSSGSQGLLEAQARAHELVLLSASLQDMTGLQVLQALKMNPLTAQTPVLLVSARLEADTESCALVRGAADVIHTPLRAEALRSRVRLHLNLGQQARALQSADLALSESHGLHESLDDLIVTAHTAWQDAQAGRRVEDHCARLLAAAQRLKRIFEAASVAPDGAAVGHADADGPPAHPQDCNPG